MTFELHIWHLKVFVGCHIHIFWPIDPVKKQENKYIEISVLEIGVRSPKYCSLIFPQICAQSAKCLVIFCRPQTKRDGEIRQFVEPNFHPDHLCLVASLPSHLLAFWQRRLWFKLIFFWTALKWSIMTILSILRASSWRSIHIT